MQIGWSSLRAAIENSHANIVRLLLEASTYETYRALVYEGSRGDALHGELRPPQALIWQEGIRGKCPQCEHDSRKPAMAASRSSGDASILKQRYNETIPPFIHATESLKDAERGVLVTFARYASAAHVPNNRASLDQEESESLLRRKHALEKLRLLGRMAAFVVAPRCCNFANGLLLKRASDRFLEALAPALGSIESFERTLYMRDLIKDYAVSTPLEDELRTRQEAIAAAQVMSVCLGFSRWRRRGPIVLARQLRADDRAALVRDDYASFLENLFDLPEELFRTAVKFL
jgi:hypothetical protein